jgi:saccharopine dehydrogenase-like NADP-dependent oxidoreductase
VTDARKIYHGQYFGNGWSAIQITTAGSLCAVVDLHFDGNLPKQGFVRQEQVSLDDFLANRFGACYADAPTEMPIRNGSTQTT